MKDLNHYDIVHVKMRVWSAGEEVTVINHDGDPVPVRYEDIVHVESSPIKVGDRVVWSNMGKVHYYIVAIDKAYAWIKSPSGSDEGIITLTKNLTRDPA